VEIPLPAFLERHGYEAQANGAASYRMVSPSDTLAVSRKNGTWLYLNERDPKDAGSIIRFVQNHLSQTLGETRRTLRPCLNDASLANAQKLLDQHMADQRFGMSLERKQRDAAELERFVREIPLPRLLEEHGFALDRKESGRNSLKYRDGKDILIVGQKEGRWGYFSALDEKDHGSVVNFVQNHIEQNLGRVREYLRPYIGEERRSWREAPSVPREFQGENTRLSDTDLNEAWKSLPSLQGQAEKYMKGRALNRETLMAYGRSMRTVAIGHHQNVGFAHVQYREEKEGFVISGWETKGPGKDGERSFSGFSTGGQKGLAVFCHKDRDPGRPLDRLTICEASIDALSKAQMDGLPRQDGYVSTGGQWREESIRALEALLVRNQPREVVLGMDNDEPGAQKAAAIRNHLEDIQERNGLTYEIIHEVPAMGKDWNEQLQALAHGTEALDKADGIEHAAIDDPGVER
jgi:hypothetical protein